MHDQARKSVKDKVRGTIGFSRIGAVYVWIAIIVVFSIWIPGLFLQVATFHSIVNQYSITAIAALSIIAPLASGVFDLSIGANMGLSGVIAGWLLGNTGLNAAEVITITLCCGAVIGAFNSLIVVKFRIDSFIGTLATGSIITALALGVSGDQILTKGLAGGFTRVASASIGGVILPVFYMLALMVVIGFVLGQTPIGRYLYATGYNAEATRLVGIDVDRIRIGALMFSGVVAAFAGVLVASSVGAADPNGGAAYLIPAFSAEFLGATQFLRGRFNSWGTVLAVLLIGTGSVGLLLAGSPQWAPQVFQGAVLIIAVGVTVHQRRSRPETDEEPDSSEVEPDENQFPKLEDLANR